MSKVLKKISWLFIVTGVFIVIVYYRSFLFTDSFNKPVDVVVDDAAEALGIEIPSYQPLAHETSLQGKVPGDESEKSSEVILGENSRNGRVRGEKPAAEHMVSMGADTEYQVVDEPRKTEPPAVEILPTEPGRELSIDDIVVAVKDTVNEALNIFIEENEEQSKNVKLDKISVLNKSDLLFKARLAYWNKDMKTAEETYIKLTEIVDDPNAFGELGNLYYMQSRWKQASDAYYRAAINLKKINHNDQAFHLLRIIQGLDTDTANRLKIKLQQSG